VIAVSAVERAGAPDAYVAGAGLGLLAGAGLLIAGFGALDVAAVLAVILVAMLYLLPAVALRASGLIRVSDRASVSEVNRVVGHARQLVPGLLGVVPRHVVHPGLRGG
jgi:uncharacterized protein (DUF58 family)